MTTAVVAAWAVAVLVDVPDVAVVLSAAAVFVAFHRLTVTASLR